MKRAGVILVALALLTEVLAGCAVNDRGLLTVDRVRTNSGETVQLRAFGIHLVAAPPLAYVAVGSSRVTLFVPTQQVANLPDGLEFAGLLASSTARGTPYAIHLESTGLAFRCSDLDVGLSVGMHSSFLLRVPREFDGVIELIHANAAPRKGALLLKERLP